MEGAAAAAVTTVTGTKMTAVPPEKKGRSIFKKIFLLLFLALLEMMVPWREGTPSMLATDQTKTTAAATTAYIKNISVTSLPSQGGVAEVSGDGSGADKETDLRTPTATDTMAKDHLVRENTRLIANKSKLCPSLYKVGGRTEHSPLVFDGDGVLVCRCPKAGSTALRKMAQHYQKEKGRKFKTLDQVQDQREFLKYVHGPETTRLAFVRHPVTRILSGFLQVGQTFKLWKRYGFQTDYGNSARAFEFWLANSNFTTEYEASCSDVQKYSLDRMQQHWLPPQHCRCGIMDCGISWTFVKLEDNQLGPVMRQHVPSLPASLTTNTSQVNAKHYNRSAYLTEKVLSTLNLLTEKEQEFFGYQPYSV